MTIIQTKKAPGAIGPYSQGVITGETMEDFAVFNSVYEKYFISKPARSCVAVKTLPKGVLCEIEAMAEL